MISTTTSDTAPGLRAAVSGLAIALMTAAALSAVHGVGATPADDGPIDYIGRVDATGALVAVAADGRDVTAYVMGRGGTAGERFEGVLDGEAASLRATDGASMVLRLVGGAARGTVTPLGGLPSAFTTSAVEGGPMRGAAAPPLASQDEAHRSGKANGEFPLGDPGASAGRG